MHHSHSCLLVHTAKRTSGHRETSARTCSWALKRLSLSRCMPGVRNRKPNKARTKPNTELAAIYEEPQLSEKIPIKYACKIESKSYQDYIVYESYKARNLREMQDYMHFVLNIRKVLPNIRPRDGGRVVRTVEEMLNSEDVSQEIKNYYNVDTDVVFKLPDNFGIPFP